MERTEKHMQLDRQFGARNYEPLPIVISSAEGVWVRDVEGTAYMDMLSAYSALNQGHRHPHIIEALMLQADRLTLTSRAFLNDVLGPFYEKLAAYTGKPRILPMNTGAEAVETAIKAARRWGYRVKGIAPGQAEIVVFEGNFHGRTLALTSFSSTEQYRRDFEPFIEGFRIIPYGEREALEAAVGTNTAAVLIEPIQGEAGVRIPPDGFLAYAAQLCAERQTLLIADEIQTGFGRTGRRFGCDWEGVVPHIYILGKALGGGVIPISAIAGDESVMELFEPGSHGSTFGGNPLACAVASAAIEVIEKEALADRSDRLGQYMMEKLKTLTHPDIKEIRGRGLFIAIELHVPARPYCEKLMELGLLCKETHRNVIRLAPPLIINEAQIDWAVARLKQVLHSSSIEGAEYNGDGHRAVSQNSDGAGSESSD